MSITYPVYGHPGVYVSETLSGPSPSATSVSPSTAAMVGEHWRGPSVPVLCSSWSDFVTFFGGFNPNPVPVLANPYLAPSAYQFFANGGQQLWVGRIGASAQPGASASVNLVDSQATPVPTLSLTAGVLGIVGNPGSWGNNLYVDVIPGASGRFSLNLYWGGVGAQYMVEQWYDLSMSPSDSRYAVNLINSKTAGSVWVVATDLNDPAVAPNNTPTGVLGRSFTGGADPSDPATSDYVAALTYGNPGIFDLVVGPLNVAIPGVTSASSVGGLLGYAEDRPYTFAVVDPPSGQTPAGAVSYAEGLAPVTPDAAVYYPWVYASDPKSGNPQSTLLLPPSPFVLGQMATTDRSVGVWRAPAGLSTALTNVVGCERRLSSADQTSLTQAHVNALLTRPTGDVVIWGTRTLESGYADMYVPVRRTLNYIEYYLEHLLQFAVFQANDEVLWTTITATCDSFLNGMFVQGAFAGTTAAQSYYVTCDSTVNTPQLVSQGVVTTLVGVALQYPAEFISLKVAQFQGTQQTVVTPVAA